MAATEVTQQNFQAEVLNQPGTVLVDFHAPWCGPCRSMGPIVDELQQELEGQTRVVKVDIDVSPSLATHFGVQSIPTFLILEDGEVRDRFVGAVSKQTLLDSVQSLGS